MIALRMIVVVLLTFAMATGAAWVPIGAPTVWAGTPICVPGNDPDADCDGDGFSPNAGDCDDGDPTSYPSAPEAPDGNDNNCNGIIDEVAGARVIANGGEVTVQLQPTGAGFDADIWLFGPGDPVLIGTNRDSSLVSLGTFPAGVELRFGTIVHNDIDNADDRFYTGAACRNFDATVHAAVKTISTDTALVGFEDLRGGGDLSYNDSLLTVTGVTVVADPGACSLAHFMCYSIKASPGTKLALGPKNLSLLDALEDKLFDVKKPATLCNPAAKTVNGDFSPVDDNHTHLEARPITQSKGQAKFVKRTGVAIDNQFGTVTLDLIKADRLMVPTAKSHVAPPAEPDPGKHQVDHFKCYGAKVTAGMPKFQTITGVRVVDQFDQPKDVDLKKITRLCLPVDKNGEGIPIPSQRLLCYQAVPPKTEPKHVKVLGVFINNQFDEAEVDTIKETELCVPSSENVPI